MSTCRSRDKVLFSVFWAHTRELQEWIHIHQHKKLRISTKLTSCAMQQTIHIKVQNSSTMVRRRTMDGKRISLEISRGINREELKPAVSDSMPNRLDLQGETYPATISSYHVQSATIRWSSEDDHIPTRAATTQVTCIGKAHTFGNPYGHLWLFSIFSLIQFGAPLHTHCFLFKNL